MLKVMFLKKSPTLILQFDVPVPASVEASQEFQDVLKPLQEYGQAMLSRYDGQLTAVSVTPQGWLDFIACVLPAHQESQRQMLEILAGSTAEELGEGLQINFHQKTFDTPERYWYFILKQGEFAEYFLNRVIWYVAPKNRVVTPFPLHVDIESANTCNMNCPMCYNDQIKEKGQMDFDVFTKIVDECSQQGLYSIRLSWRGETLTHPRIKDMIAYAVQRIKNVSFLTNAFYLTGDMVDCFIQNGVNYISVSFDGMGATYEKIRRPARFDENREKVRMLFERRCAASSTKPQVRLCTIWPAIRENPQGYYDAMKDVSDYIVYNPYINFLGPMKIKENFICQYPWERIVIGFNGKAQCCTGWNAQDIILGNVTEESISTMWHSPLMRKIRDIHAAGNRMALASCEQCRHGSAGDPNIGIEDILAGKY